MGAIHRESLIKQPWMSTVQEARDSLRVHQMLFHWLARLSPCALKRLLAALFLLFLSTAGIVGPCKLTNPIPS